MVGAESVMIGRMIGIGQMNAAFRLGIERNRPEHTPNREGTHTFWECGSSLPKTTGIC